jgi:hypothetical protein
MTDDLRTASDLKRALHDGRVFAVEFTHLVCWVHFVEEYGPAMHEIHRDEHTHSGSMPDGFARAAVSQGTIYEIDESEIPVPSDSNKNFTDFKRSLNNGGEKA